MLKKLGFDKIVELTFGAKMINREYHKQLKNSKKFIISTACPGIVQTIEKKYPKYKKNLARIYSPMVATGKISKKIYPKHKTIFISPCNFKKIEASKNKEIDYVIDYMQLAELFKKYKIKKPLIGKKNLFDKFYNDYTKIYPLAGGLSKTAHLKGVLKQDEVVIIDGVLEVQKYLNGTKNPSKFLDFNFCIGGCIGGPCTNQKLSIKRKKKRVLKYLRKSKRYDIPETRKGLIKKAKGIKFTY